MLVIAGKHGLIARRLARTAERRRIAAKFTSSRPDPGDLALDLENADDFDYGQLRANDQVLLLAAISSPDRCRRDPDRSRVVNVTGTIHFIEQALHRGARVLFASSDTVYGERRESCDERSVPRPLGEYASMKHEVERRFQCAEGFKAMRLSYVFSGEDRFTAQLAQCVHGGQEADVFAGLDRRVVHIDDVVEAALAAFDDWSKIDAPWFNVGGEQLVSRADMASAYRRLCAPSLRFTVREPGDDFYRARPRVIDMESRYLAELLGRRPRSLDEAMTIEFGLEVHGGKAAHDG